MKLLPLPREKRRLLAPLGRIALTCLLSGGCFGQLTAPLALAMTAAAGPGAAGLCCVLGAGLGALLLMPFQTGLRHLAAAILLYSGNIAFYDTGLYRRRAFRPVMAAALTLLVQSVYLLARPVRLWALCAACLLLLAAATALLLRGETVLVTAAGLCLAAGRLSIAGAGVGYALAAALLLRGRVRWPQQPWLAWSAGLGLALGLLPESPTLLPAAVLFGGCAALCLWPAAPVPVQAALFCAGGGGCALLFGAEEPLGWLLALLAGGLLSLLPPRPRPAAPEAAPPPPPEPRPAVRRAARPAAALRELYDSLFRGLPPEQPENPSVLFDRAAEQVCRRCVLRDTCWQQEYNATYNAFNDACPRLLRRGEARPEDFPLYFTSRCVQLAAFLAALNGELHSYLLRRQYQQRLQQERSRAREQYAQLGELLDCRREAVPAGAQLLGYRVASALRPREGQSVCGDVLSVFEAEGFVYLLLSDGMGSGEAAHREAALTVRLLQQFLEAGIRPLPALKTLNSALSLRRESGGGFTTIDLLALRRSSGEAALYKYGAAPSYLRSGGRVSRFTGASLPAGLQAPADAPECTQLQLRAGSWFVMVSDGVADADSDEWLQNLLAGWSGRDVHALVDRILSESGSRKGQADDCAVLAVWLPGQDGGEKRRV